MVDQLPAVYAEIQDQGLKISRPVLQPKVTLLGYCNNTGEVDTFNPYQIDRREDANRFDDVDAVGGHTPSELSKAIDETYQGGADNVEVMVLGTGFIDADTRFTHLATAYNLLLNTDVDIVVPVEARLDTPVTNGAGGVERNFAYQLANFCYRCTINRNTAIGMNGCEPPIASESATPTLAEMNAWITALTSYNTAALQGRNFQSWDGHTDANGDGMPDNYAYWATSDQNIPVGTPPGSNANVERDALGNPIDIGAYISILAAHVRSTSGMAVRVAPTRSWYYHDAAATYAGLVSALPAKEAPTNRILPNSTPSRNISLAQALALQLARFVTVLTKPNGNRLTAAVTSAYNISQFYRSDFVNLATVRIVHDAINTIRDRCEQFLGRPNNPTNMNAMETEIDEGLQAMVTDGALNDFEFSIITTPAMQILGEVLVDIKLDVAHEIREITARIGLVPPGTLG